MKESLRRRVRVGLGTLAVALMISSASSPHAQAPAQPAAGQRAAAPAAKAPTHAKAAKRLLIRGAMVIPGPGVPANGPVSLLVEDGLIARVGAENKSWPAADGVIDATGKYVMPGIVNTHMHWHEERVGPIPIQYERNLYLAAGVTTAREVGGNFEKTKQWRAESAAHTIIAPRILLYPMLANMLAKDEPFNQSPAEIRKLVINGNPLANLRIMNPYGTDVMAYDGEIIDNYSAEVRPNDPGFTSVHGGGIEWTIKDGIPYHVPTLMKEVKDMVAKARATPATK
jgi:hypothetical protein